ncbi:MAG: diguanylate cyclase [Gammaproteobacteria bacterium]
MKDSANNKNFGKITVSIGIAELSNPETPETFIHRCDKALYRAKEYGRNCGHG